MHPVDAPPGDTRMVVVFSADATARRAADVAARAAGYRTRVASRPAELIKALDGRIGALWALDGDLAAAVRERLAPATVLVLRTAGEPLEQFVGRALAVLSDGAAPGGQRD